MVPSGSIAAGRHGAWEVAESLCLKDKYKADKERANWEWHSHLKPQMSSSVTSFLHQGHTC